MKSDFGERWNAMKIRPVLMAVGRMAVLFSAAGAGMVVAPGLRAQTTTPPYIAEMPSVDKVMKAMQTSNPDETAGRRIAAFWQLQQMILDMAGPRQYRRGGLTSDEMKARQAYYTAYYNILHQGGPRAMHFAAGPSSSPLFRHQLIQQLFPPGFATQYANAMAQSKQGWAQLHQRVVQAAQAREKVQQQAAQQAGNQLWQRYQAQQQEAHMDPQTREMRRCITAGRVMAVCVGHGLMGSLMPNVNALLSSVAPGTVGREVTGPQMAGVFLGSGWRLEFSEASVGLSCQDMIPDSHAYTISFVRNRAVLDIANVPKDIVMTVDGDTLAGWGPMAVQGRVSEGVHQGYDPVTERPATIYQYLRVTRTCAKPVLRKSSNPGVVGAEKNLLVGLFNDGDAGPPTPAGLRMNGSYAASTGFSVEFFPESAILGCGPDVARAYPYTVIADGRQAVVKVAAPGHPLTLLIKSNNMLDPGSGTYLVEGRRITGQGSNGDYTFAPLNATCHLAPLSPGPVPSIAVR